MSKTIRATALGAGLALLLAACGGRPDDAPAQSGQHIRVAVAPARIDPVAVDAAPSNGETIPLKQQVAQLRRDVAEIRQQLARMPASASSAEGPPDPRTDPNARLEAERVEQQRIASTETAFRSEKEDARWSQGTVAAVRAALGEIDESLRNQISSVECRSQSCRVVIGGDTRGPAGRDLPLVMMRLAATLPNVTAGQIDQGDGRPATVLYLSR